MLEFKPFVCFECGSMVRLLPSDNDFLLVKIGGRLYEAVVPSHVQLPKCEYCGIHYFGQTQYDRVSMEMGADPPEKI